VLIGDVPVKLLRVEVAAEVAAEVFVESTGAPAVGVFGPDGVIATRAGSIRVIEIQPVGKRAMPMAEFLAGRSRLIGSRVQPVVAGG
jgi:methionyl-tRNA formyltransferase